MPEQLFVRSALFHALVAKIASLDKDHPEFENQIVTTLGEDGGIWPDSIKDEAEA